MLGLRRQVLREIIRRQLAQFAVQNDKVMATWKPFAKQFDDSENRLQARFDDKVEKVQGGDELPPA